MASFHIRSARNTDDFLKIAIGIYLTDPFIYPAAFGENIRLASYAISKLMLINEGLFHPNNLILAVCDDEICGVLLFNKGGVTWNQKVCTEMVKGIVPSINNFNHVSDLYFSVEAENLPKNHIAVIACCTFPRFQNMGVGKCLLEWLINEYSEYTLTLDVLSNNFVAIRLYKNCGFKIVNETKGFSLEEETRPDCYHMIRKPDDLGGWHL